jgi:hypothetical protein
LDLYNAHLQRHSKTRKRLASLPQRGLGRQGESSFAVQKWLVGVLALKVSGIKKVVCLKSKLLNLHCRRKERRDSVGYSCNRMVSTYFGS